MVKLAFPRELRLLTPKHFNFVFQQPQRASSPEVTILGRQTIAASMMERCGIVIKSLKCVNEDDALSTDFCRRDNDFFTSWLTIADWLFWSWRGIISQNETKILFLLPSISDLKRALNKWHCWYKHAGCKIIRTHSESARIFEGSNERYLITYYHHWCCDWSTGLFIYYTPVCQRICWISNYIK